MVSVTARIKTLIRARQTTNRSSVQGALLISAVLLLGCTAREVQLFQTEQPLSTDEDDVGSGPTGPSPGPNSSTTPVATLPDAGPSEPVPSVTPELTPTPEPHWSELGDELLIDDFEDGNTQALASNGWWYVTNDGTSDQLLAAEEHADRPGSTLALRTQGSGFEDWGAFVGLNLGGQPGVFDAEPANAIRFWALSETPRDVVVRFIQQDNVTFRAVVPLPTQWTEIVVPFQAFSSNNPNATLSPSRLVHLQLFFDLEPFDVWLDDFAFVILP